MADSAQGAEVAVKAVAPELLLEAAVVGVALLAAFYLRTSRLLARFL